MKHSGKLTIQFSLYFILFYLFILVGTIGSLILLVFFINDRTGNDIHTFDAFELEDQIVQTEDGMKIKKSLREQATENSGQIYLLSPSTKVLDYTGKTCGLCTMTKEDILNLNMRGMEVWKISKYYLYFIPQSPLEPLFNEVHTEWVAAGKLSASLQKKLEAQSISIEIYDKKWRRQLVIGKEKPIVNIPDINHFDLFEQKEWLQATTLADGNTLVARMPNKFYKPSEAVYSKATIILITFFILFHIILLIGIILLSFGISKRFMRPIIYILLRIEKLAQFDYKKVTDNRIHHAKTSKLKRKFKLFQPVDDSINNLSERLSYNERQLKQVEKLREEWITGLSHDLKTPLSSIYGYSTMLASNDYHWTPEETRAFAQTMQEKANYMDALIQDLTYTYQLKNKTIVLNFETVPLTTWLQTFADEQVTIEVQDHLTVSADPLLLQRVIDNLVGNAKRHTPEGTPIVIEAKEIQTGIRLRIIDHGPGIPQEELDNLFERYYRGTNTTDDITGTGLGLAIAKQLIELHNGTIDVLSNKNGTVFTIYLPKTLS